MNYEGIRLLFDGLQQPLLNKQVGGGWGDGGETPYSSGFVSTDDLRLAGRGRAGAFSRALQGD